MFLMILFYRNESDGGFGACESASVAVNKLLRLEILSWAASRDMGKILKKSRFQPMKPTGVPPRILTGDGNVNLSKFRILIGTGRYVFLTLDQ